MTNMQRIQLRLSEVRSRLNELAGKGEPTTEELAEMDALSTEYKTLETQHRAAIIAESEKEVREDGQPAEERKLTKRVKVSPFLLEAIGGRQIDGAEKELREAVFGDDAVAGQIPLDVLGLGLPEHRTEEQETEHRADAGTSLGISTQENQAAIAGRIFAQGSGPFLGIQRPTVAVGTAAYPVLTGGTTADARSPGVAKDAEAATLGVTDVTPFRVSSRYLFAIEDVQRVQGWEEALAADLRQVVEDKLDFLGINGQEEVANVSPEVVGILNSLPDPTDPTDSATWKTFFDALDALIDGKYSMDGNNTRLLVNAQTLRYAYGAQVAISGALLRGLLPQGRVRTSSNMPATVNTIATAIAYASPHRGLIQPVWRGLNAIRDPYTHASEGQVAITLNTMVGSAMVDSNPYRRVEFKV